MSNKMPQKLWELYGAPHAHPQGTDWVRLLSHPQEPHPFALGPADTANLGPSDKTTSAAFLTN